MTGLEALAREIRIAWYRWALRNMGPLHRDVPEVVLRLYTLERQRPPIVTRVRSRCADLPGMCARDPNCEDRRCPGLYQRDGGMQVHGPLSFPIEPGATS